jgi:hypothetical protein
MAEIYKAVFRCPELNEKEVWFVSSRKHAQTMLNRHIKTGGSHILSRYRSADYSYTVTPIFQTEGEAGYDTTILGH